LSTRVNTVRTGPELINLYLVDLRRANRSALTIKNRRSYLGKFDREVGLITATPEQIENWLDRDSLQPQSRTLWLTMLNGFYEWAKRKRQLKTNPAHKDYIDRPRGPDYEPHPITPESLDRALAAADPKMRCWLLAGAAEGCRAQEIAGIRREDVREFDEILHIEYGKGDKQREVPLHPDFWKALNELPAWSEQEGHLWNLSGQQMSRKINAHLRKVGAKNVLGERATAHHLRHYFGCEAYQISLDLLLVGRYMGHRNPATTAGYARADHRKGAAVIKQIKVGAE
jgi:integrase/recombinase XerC